MSYDKPTSKDIARLIVSLTLFVVAVGSFTYLVSRFGVNPYKHQNKVSLAQLVGMGKDEVRDVKVTSFAKGQVAGANTMLRFEVTKVNASTLLPDRSTVDFTRIDNKAMLRYKGIVYAFQGSYDPTPQTIPDADRYPWKALIDAVGKDIALSGFVSSPDTTAFVFVLGNGKAFEVYAYSEYDTESKVRKVHTFKEGEMPMWMPRAAGVSDDGRYANLAMFPCPDCLSTVPETLLIDVRTGYAKNIGKTSLFAWEADGAYKYKEYQEVDCPDGASATKCAIDPQFLDFKTGAIR